MMNRLAVTVAALLVVRTALAQPLPAPSPTPPPGDRDAPASEPVLAPEHIAAKLPATPQPEEPITVDQIVIASTNRVDLNFFGDVSMVQSTAQDAAFAIGPLGFQVTAHLTQELVGRTEFAMSFDNGDTVLDVERAYLEYRSPHWMLAAGRTHAELGYWNNAFHHGRWLQLTINRPRVLRFEDEGGMLPVHQVGITAVYGPSRGEAGLEVGVGVGNGHGRVLEQIQTTGDDNHAKSMLLRVGAVGYGHPALRFGINVAVDDIAAQPEAVRPLAPDASILELITGVYLSLRAEHVLVFSETYNIAHFAMGQSWQVTDGFLLAGYRLDKTIPYAQIEARRGDGAVDPFYNPSPALNSETVSPTNYVEGLVGVHYDLNSWSALKLEVADRRFNGTSDYRVELNWSFGR